MKTHTTTLGLTTEGGARVYPLTLQSIERVTEPKKVEVLILSTWINNSSTVSFKTPKMAAEFIERMNESVYFIARLNK